jgi:endonuclease YncB( thermonuclease family)
MAKWAANRRSGYGTRIGARSGVGALVLTVLLVGSIGFYFYKHWPRQVLSTITGLSHVIDGDTIDIAGTRIRLLAIDAPELEQKCRDAERRSWDCGSAAARALRDHIDGQELKCESSRLDRFKRVLAICFLPDGSDVNAWMVRQGWAVAFRTTKQYRAQHDEAEAAKRGIWAGSFMTPWKWREGHPPRSGDAGI